MFEVIELSGVKTVTTKAACNHVYVVDVSGSMYSSLQMMRQHLKNIITMVATPGDTFSIVYFSGKGQFGTVFSNLKVDDPSVIAGMHSAIDRFLQPICLTGFAEPIQMCIDLVDELDNDYNNFVMLTDGYDNQSSKPQILENCTKLGEVYDSCSFIEYGWYCDRDLIGQMAEKCGGIHIFAEGYDQYEDVFVESITGSVAEQSIEVKVNKNAKHAVYIRGNNIVISDVVDGITTVPESVTKVHSIVPKDVLQKHLSEEHVFLIMYYAIKVQNNKLIWNCLEFLGDVKLIKQYTNAFTKQELSTFEDSVKDAVLDETKRFEEGKDVSFVPNKNAFTSVECLDLLVQNNSQLVMSSPLFEYNRTTLGNSVNGEKSDIPVFIADPLNMVDINSLTFNSERPNISIKVTKPGSVRLPESEFFKAGTMIRSVQHKNYTIIRDGIINMKILPVMVSPFVIEVLDESGVSYEKVCDMPDTNQVYININMSSMPVVNRTLVNNTSLVDFAQLMQEMNVLKARQKVIKALIVEETGETSSRYTGLAEEHGVEAAKYLSSIGVRDYGFSAVGTSSFESTDFYTSIQLSSKIKGISSLPALDKVRTKVGTGKKLTVSEHLIHTELEKYEGMELKVLNELQLDYVKMIRAIQAKLAETTYAIIIGRSWFVDCTETPAVADLDFGDGYVVPLTVDIVRKDIKV